MDLGITGRRAIVAAGTAGLGLGTAQALADEGVLVAVCGRNPDRLDAAVAALGPAIVTSEFKINYLRPATGADRLVAVATVVGSGKTQAVCRCDIFLERGGERKLCAAAQGTIRKVD